MTTLYVFKTDELTDSEEQLTDFSFYHLCSLPIQLYLVDSFLYAASATSAAAVSHSSIYFYISLVINLVQLFVIQLFRSLFGLIFPLFGQPMFDKLGLGGGNSVRLCAPIYLPLDARLKKKNSYWPVLPSLLASRSLSGFFIKVKDCVLEIH